VAVGRTIRLVLGTLCTLRHWDDNGGHAQKMKSSRFRFFNPGKREVRTWNERKRKHAHFAQIKTLGCGL
jgi:hypothetical protein